ncbi:MAG: spore maturation protein [Clostridiales bacterium]|jgi:spore maturation protein B|nr:spore maturation protein [Clostridiales bacterium]
MANFILPFLIAALFIYAAIKRIRVYDSFIDGVKDALKLVYSVFPYLAAIFIMVNLFRASGLSGYVTKLLSKPMSLLGIPPELTELILLRPFSGNGSLLLLEDIYAAHGADSYIARTASVIVGSSDTAFYIAAVYFAESKVTKLRYAIPAALAANFLGVIVSCLVCRFL